LRIFKIFLAVTVCLLAAACAHAQTPAGQWGPFGLVVGDALGRTSHINPRIAEIKPGVFFAVWEDSRSGRSNIYMQKIDQAGDLMLDANGVAVCKYAEDQTNPRIVTDSAGGAIIIWQDNRSGNFNIYAQRIDENGNPLWTKEGVPVCEFPAGQFFPEVISDGQGGAIVTWYDYRSGSEDVYVQRLNSQGQILFAPEGVPVCKAPGTQWFPKLVTDGRNGAIIAWMDRRSGNFDVYAQRVDYSGKLLWGESGLPICVMEGNQENVEIIDDGAGGAIIAWKDSRSTAPGLYVQKINPDGAPLLPVNGTMVSQDTDLVSALDLAPTKQGGAMIVWSDPHAGDADIYVQQMDASGRMVWMGGQPVAQLRGEQNNPRIFGRGPLYFIVWEDKRQGKTQLYCQKIKDIGEMLLPENGIPLSDSGIEPQLGEAVFSASEIFTYIYQDRKKGNNDIYGGAVSRDGKISWLEAVNETNGAVVHDDLDLAVTSGGVVFAFRDFRNGFSNIYLQKISKEGKMLWKENGVAAAPGSFNERAPKVVSDGKGGAIVAWEDYRSTVGPRIYTQRIEADGDISWARDGVPLAPKAPSINQIKPNLVEDGMDGAIAVYVDYRSDLNYQDIYAQRIGPDGTPMWGGEGKVVTTANGNQDDPVISPKTFFVAWTDFRNGDRNSDIFAQKLELSGRTVFQEDGIPVCEAPDNQRDPAILNDGKGGVVIAWTDRGGGSYDIYAQKLDATGSAAFTKDGIPVCQAARTQQGVTMARVPDATMIFWEDFRFDNWDIFSQKMGDLGQMTFTEEGIPVCIAPNTQYAPFAVPIKNGALVAWEDYRNGRNYNIFLQEIGQDGKILLPTNGYLVAESMLGGRHPKMAALPDNSVVLGWEDHRYGRRSIYAQRFTLGK